MIKLKQVTKRICSLQDGRGISDNEMGVLMELPPIRSWAFSCNNDIWYVADILKLAEIFGKEPSWFFEEEKVEG